MSVANPEVMETDARGRVLTFKRPGVLAQFRLIEMLGDSAKNEVFVSMVLPLLYLMQINDDTVHFSTRRELDALIQELDEDGIACVVASVQKHYAGGEAANEQIKK